MFLPERSTRLVSALIGLLLVCSGQVQTRGAEKAQIQQAIERGKQFLLKQNKIEAAGALACYSLVKAGVDKQHPDIQKAVQTVRAKCESRGYFPGGNYNYEAGVDAMLLEAVDREAYLPQLELIAQFLIARQRPHGGWYYPSEGASNDFGDTSITQYAILGLWAASRAGVEVPTETWERAAKWLLATQSRDGGFGYHPVAPAGQGQGQVPEVSTGTMTVAGTGSLLVIRQVLFRETDFDDGVRPTAATRRFGVLERMTDEKEKTKPKVKTNPSMSAAAFDKGLKEGIKWTGDRFGEPRALGTYVNYYFYGIERVAALLDVEKIGTHDWYNEGADELLKRQLAEGGWNDSCGQIPATALTLLFLTKATAGTISKPKRTPMVGGGLLVGGRGLPDNLDAVKINEGEVSKRKLHGPVDSLLAELEKSSGAKVEAAQKAVVEAVQLEHPEELIGQVDRLKRLSADKRIEVRRTAMWALGRTGNVSVAPFLIRGLSDADESVVREASAALSILSRRPNGWRTVPVDPWDGLADEATNEERSAHLKNWQKKSTDAWTDWYMKVRPYDERDDRTTLKRKS